MNADSVPTRTATPTDAHPLRDHDRYRDRTVTPLRPLRPHNSTDGDCDAIVDQNLIIAPKQRLFGNVIFGNTGEVSKPQTITLTNSSSNVVAIRGHPSAGRRHRITP